MDDDNVGEYIFSGVASPDHAYHYQALFRIGCPTHQFDAENTVIDLELLGANHELEMQKIRFSAASMSRTRMDIYICNMYVLKPITSIQSVRAYLSGGNLDSAIFLFDIAIKLVDCPGPEDDEYNLQDKYFIPSKRVEENEIIYTQKLKIFAYIVSTPRVYYKLTNERNESSPLPPILYMFPTNGVLLIFVWLTSLFAILLVLYVLGKCVQTCSWWHFFVLITILILSFHRLALLESAHAYRGNLCHYLLHCCIMLCVDCSNLPISRIGDSKQLS